MTQLKKGCLVSLNINDNNKSLFVKIIRPNLPSTFLFLCWNCDRLKDLKIQDTTILGIQPPDPLQQTVSMEEPREFGIEGIGFFFFLLGRCLGEIRHEETITCLMFLHFTYQLNEMCCKPFLLTAFLPPMSSHQEMILNVTSFPDCATIPKGGWI